jgi:hypothetical protein
VIINLINNSLKSLGPLLKSLRQITIIFVCLINLGLTACGGGGGGSSSSSTSSGSSMSGTAAVGAPIANATVTIYDSTGAVVGSTTTNADGEYSAVINGGTAPYVVEIIGGVGDSVGKYYAVANNTGTVNINQVSNAIAAALSNSGNPSNLITSPAVAANITAIENAFMSAYSRVLSAFGVAGSLISGTFSTTIDEVLDMIDAVILPDGTIELSSSEGQPMPEIMGTFDTNTTPVAHKINIIQAGNLPNASTANNIPAPSQSVIATAKTLEPLRAKLEKCFSHTASERATQASASNTSPSWTSIHSDCQNLAFDVSSSDGFKHDSYYWIDNSTLNSKNYLSGCANSGSAMCLGFFGSMLTDTTNNNLKFLRPTHIAPIDTNLWRVQFPVVYDDESKTRGQFGDEIGSTYAVVKYETGTQSFKFYGNQRDVQTNIQPSATLAQKAGTSNYRVETGFNIFIRPYNSRSLKRTGVQVYPVKALITPIFSASGMIPVNGVYLANKVTGTPSTIGGVPSGSSSTPLNVCTFMNFEDPSIISSSYKVSTANASSCSGVIRMNYAEYTMANNKLTASTGAYPPTTTSVPAWITGWNTSGGTTGSGSLITVATAKRGEPYLFTLTMSDGSTIKYINRLPTSTLTTEQAALLNFPQFTPDMSARFAAYDGSASNTLSVTWKPLDTALIFADAIYWNRGEVNSTARISPGLTSNTISCPAPATVYASNISVQNSAGDTVRAMDCRDSLNWKSSNSSSPNQGIIQLKARTFDGLFIQSQLRQY